MKRILKILCLFLLAALFISCADQADVNEARMMFADRVTEPMLVEKTVGHVQYTVTLNSDEYYLGDDIDMTVAVKNVGTEPLTVTVNAIHPVTYALCAGIRADGELLTVQCLQKPFVAAGASDSVPWAVGETLSNHGRYSTSVEREKLNGVQEIQLVIFISGTEECLEIPLTLHTDIPQDTELLPYLEQGLITEALYARARVMNDEDMILVLVPDSDDGYTKVGWTRAAMLDYLETHSSDPTATSAPLKYLFESWVEFWAEGYTLDENFELRE